MKSDEKKIKHNCEFCDCDKEGVIYDDYLDTWLCEQHGDSVSNTTGYCGVNCQLGYGCDQSC